LFIWSLAQDSPVLQAAGRLGGHKVGVVLRREAIPLVGAGQLGESLQGGQWVRGRWRIPASRTGRVVVMVMLLVMLLLLLLLLLVVVELLLLLVQQLLLLLVELLVRRA